MHKFIIFLNKLKYNLKFQNKFFYYPMTKNLHLLLVQLKKIGIINKIIFLDKKNQYKIFLTIQQNIKWDVQIIKHKKNFNKIFFYHTNKNSLFKWTTLFLMNNTFLFFNHLKLNLFQKRGIPLCIFFLKNK